MRVRDRKRLARRARGTAMTFKIASQIHWHDRQWRARIAFLDSQLADWRGVFGAGD